MRWVVGGIAIVIVLAALAALVAPRLVEWNAYRPGIEQAFTARTGLQAEIGGDLHMTVLPTPTLFASDMRLMPSGGTGPAFATVAGLRAELALWPLLLGEIRVEAIALEQPQILLRLRRGGLQTAAAVAERLLAVGGAAPGSDAASLERLSVRDGRVAFMRGEHQVAALSGIGVDFVAPTAERTGRLRLDARWSEVPLSLALDIGALAPGGTASLRGRAELAGSLAQASYSGSLATAAAAPDGTAGAASEGSLSVTLRDPGALLSLLQVSEELAAGLPREPLTLTARLKADAGSALLNDADLRWGRTTIGGAAALDFGPLLDLDLTLQAAGLDLDPLLPLLAALPPAELDRLSLPASDRIAFDIAATALRLRGNVIRRLQLSGRLHDGVLDLQDLRAELPGSATIDLKGRLSTPGELPEFSGEVALEAADARRTLTWLGVPERQLPPAGPRRFRAQAGLALDAGLWRVIGLSAGMDGATVQGGVALRPSGRPSFSANLRLADLDLDPWLATLRTEGETAGGTASAADRLRQMGTLLSGFDSNLRLGARNLTWRGQRVAQARLDLMLVRGALTLSRAALATDAGLSLEGAGSATAEPGVMEYDLALSAVAERLAALPDIVAAFDPAAGAGRLEQPLLARPLAEPLQVSLQLTGDASQALVRDLELRLPGAALGGRGTVGLAAPSPSLAAELSWDLFDPELFFAEIERPDFLLRRHPARGGFTLTVDAGAVTVTGATLTLPMLSLTGEGSYSRSADPARFRLSLGAQAESLPALLQALRPDPAAAAGQAEGGPAGTGDAPLTLVLRAAGTARELQLEQARLGLGAAELRLEGGGSLEPLARLRGTLHLDAPELSRLLADSGLVPVPADPGLGPVRLQATFQAAHGRLVLEDIGGRAGPTALAAALGLDWQGRRPLLQAELQLEELPLDRLLPADLDALLPFATGEPAVPVRSDAVPAAVDELALDLVLSATGVGAAGGAFADGSLEARLRDGRLAVSRLEGEFFDGRIAGSAEFDLRGLPAAAASAELQGFDAAALLARLGIDGLSGHADASVRLRSAGSGTEAMLERLSGQAELALAQGRLDGVDLPALAALAGEAEDAAATAPPSAAAVERALLGGSTAVEVLSGTLFVEGGVLRLQQVQAELEAGSAAWHGSVNLPQRAMDLTASYRLAGRPEAPPVEVEAQGPLQAPLHRVLADAFTQYLVGRAAAAAPIVPPAAPQPSAAAPPAVPAGPGAPAAEDAEEEEAAPDSADAEAAAQALARELGEADEAVAAPPPEPLPDEPGFEAAD